MWATREALTVLHFKNGYWEKLYPDVLCLVTVGQPPPFLLTVETVRQGVETLWTRKPTKTAHLLGDRSLGERMEGQRARVRGQKAERHSTNRALSPGKAWGDHSHADSGYPQVSSPEAPWDPHTPKLRKPGKLLCKAHLSSGHWAVLRAEGLSSYGI